MIFSWSEGVHVIFIGYRQIIFSLTFYELVIQFQADICILIPFDACKLRPESGAFESVGEFVLSDTMT